MAFNKSVLLELDAFNPQLGRIGKKLLSNEEKSFFLKLHERNLKVYYVPEALVYHQVTAERVSKLFLIKRQYWQGISDVVWLSSSPSMALKRKWARHYLSDMFLQLRLLLHLNRNSQSDMVKHLSEAAYNFGCLMQEVRSMINHRKKVVPLPVVQYHEGNEIRNEPMKFDEAVSVLQSVPHMTPDQGRVLYDFIKEKKIKNILELGFAHGTSTCYMAIAVHELGEGNIVTIDIAGAQQRNPNIHVLLQKTGVGKYVDPIFTETTYNWELLNIIEKNTKDRKCYPVFDFCFIDGAHTWVEDGFAFFLVDKLLKPGGWILFDDIDWSFSKSPTLSQVEWVKLLPEAQRNTPQIRKVFETLVQQHIGYEDFKIEKNWGWARKKNDRS
jgi:predicted O-methyltransferase YrrM